MAEPNVTELITMTLRNRKPMLADNVSNSNALLGRLRKKGKMRTIQGGRVIHCPLEYAENAYFQRYSGYDPLSIGASEVFDAAEYDPVQAAVPVVISGRERRMNRGREQFIDLLTARIGNAEKTMANNLSADVYSDGSEDNQIGGLQHLVADDPTASATVGGIAQATWSFWQNQVVDFTTDVGTVASSSNILTGMNKLWLECLRGTDKVDLIPADDDYYTYFEAALQQNQRFADARMAESGFETLKYKTADVVYDGDTSTFPDLHMYFLNTDYLELVAYAGADMDALGVRSAVNQDADADHIVWMGNLCSSNRSLQGVLKN